MRVGSIVVALLLVSCGPEENAAPAATPSDGWSGTPPGDPIELGELCESPWFECTEGTYCWFGGWGPPRCDWIGTCAAIPASCNGEFRPVCGCDGQLYEHGCAAAQAQMNIQAADECPSPDGYFACGEGYCEIGTQYCMDIYDHGGGEYSYCMDLVCEDGLAGCECLDSMFPCGEEWYSYQSCTNRQDGSTWVSCVIV